MIIIKCLVVVLITFIAFTAADEDWKRINDMKVLNKMNTDCNEESAVTPEQMRKINSNQLPDEKEVHAYFLCGNIKLGLFSEDKGFNVDLFISQLDVDFYAEKERDIITKCADSNEQNSTNAIWVFRIWKCFKDANLKEVLIKREKTA